MLEVKAILRTVGGLRPQPFWGAAFRSKTSAFAEFRRDCAPEYYTDWLRSVLPAFVGKEDIQIFNSFTFKHPGFLFANESIQEVIELLTSIRNIPSAILAGNSLSAMYIHPEHNSYSARILDLSNTKDVRPDFGIEHVVLDSCINQVEGFGPAELWDKLDSNLLVPIETSTVQNRPGQSKDLAKSWYQNTFSRHCSGPIVFSHEHFRLLPWFTMHSPTRGDDAVASYLRSARPENSIVWNNDKLRLIHFYAYAHEHICKVYDLEMLHSKHRP